MTAKNRNTTDAFYNNINKSGTAYDPINQYVFGMVDEVLDRSKLDDLYRYNWVARRVVDLLAEDSIRNWIDLIFNEDDGELEAYISGRFDELKIKEKLVHLVVLGRLYGDAVMITGSLDGDLPEMPLNEDSIKTISCFTNLDRYQLTIDKRYENPLMPNYGEPEIYSIQLANTSNADIYKIHESRVIRFSGSYLTDHLLSQNQYFYDSELQNIYTALKHYGIATQNGAQLLVDFITKVLKIPDLATILESENGETKLLTRIRYAIAQTSSIGLTTIGEDEEYSKIQTPITGLVELIKLFMDVISAASKIPKTVLFGQALGTLSGAGETTRVYYDLIKNYQEHKVRPVIERVIKLLLIAKDNPITKGKEPEKWSFKFKPLWQETEKETIEKRKIQAESDALYIDRGVLSAEEVAINRFSPSGYSLETTLDEAIRTTMAIENEKDIELERLRVENEELKAVSKGNIK